MRDRLIELIKDAKIHECYDALFSDIDTVIDMAHGEEYAANYLLKNGVIILPCQVGDKVYCVYRKKVTQGIVKLIRPFISEKETIFKGNIICEVDNIFRNDGSKENIELHVVFKNPHGNEYVAYLSEEEAQRALEEGGQE